MKWLIYRRSPDHRTKRLFLREYYTDTPTYRSGVLSLKMGPRPIAIIRGNKIARLEPEVEQIKTIYTQTKAQAHVPWVYIKAERANLNIQNY